MTPTVVDLSARSRLVLESPLHLYYWELTPSQALAFLCSPREELTKIGVQLPEGSRIETTVVNHDYLEAADHSTYRVHCQGTGHIAEKLYRVTMHLSPAGAHSAKEILHDPAEQGYRHSESAQDRARFAMILRALHQSPTYFKVAAFLAPLIPLGKFPRTVDAAREDFLKITEVMTEMLLGDPAAKAGLDEVVAWIARPVPPELLALYERVRQPGSTPLKTFLSAIYLRALRTILAHTCGQEVIRQESAALLGDLSGLRENVLARLKKAGEHFIGTLVLEAETRAADHPDFERALKFAAESFARCRTAVAARMPEYNGAELFPVARQHEGGGVSFQGDYARDWWCIPAAVALLLTVLQDDTFA